MKTNLKPLINLITRGQNMSLRDIVKRGVSCKVKKAAGKCPNYSKSSTNLLGTSSTLSRKRLNTTIKNVTRCKHKEKSLHSVALAA